MRSIIPMIMQPTSTLLVDDDEFFIDNVKRLLPKDINPCIIPHELFNEFYDEDIFLPSRKSIDDQCLRSVTTMNSFSQLTGKPPVSTIVIDQYMNPKNGLEILSRIKSPFVQKILISNILTSDEAVQALNEGIINFFLCKMNPDFIKNLTNSIYESNARFFHAISMTSKKFLVKDNPLKEDSLRLVFENIMNKYKVRYFNSSNLRNFTFFDGVTDNNVMLHLISQEELDELLNSQQADLAATKTLDMIKAGQLLPCFPNNTFPDGDAWESYLRPAHKFEGKKTYYYSVYTER